jgi:hypothetical protein
MGGKKGDFIDTHGKSNEDGHDNGANAISRAQRFHPFPGIILLRTLRASEPWLAD